MARDPERSRPSLDVHAGFFTDTGPRPRNEDYIGCVLDDRHVRAGRGVVAAIADGVGGSKGGRVAAELTVRGFLDAYTAQDPLRGVRSNAALGLEVMNRWVNAIGRTDPALAEMACAFTALVLLGRRLHFVHVGDTRLYRLRDNHLTRLTTDHVLDQPGMRHVLTRAVGPMTPLTIDYASEPAHEHDRYLLCSDGVHGAIRDSRIAAILGQRSAPEDAARLLVQAALSGDGSDNATALVLDVLDLPPANMSDLEPALAALPILPPPRSGATIDGFVLGPMLVDGRYTRVFRATDSVTGHAVILKFPQPLTGAEPVLLQAFLREAWIATRVRNPALGEVIDLPDGRRTRLYTAMPYYPGETLERRLSRAPPLTLAAGLAIASQLARAVAALHRAGVIHRDIKPENVILVAEGGLRLIDLGVARLPGLEDFPIADTPGTAAYMAPELINGGVADERSDLFALGVTIYRTFTGDYPYGEVEAFSHPRFGSPVPLTVRRPDLPAWLDLVLSRAVAVEPDDRPGDVVELLFMLERGAIGGAPAPPRHRSLYDRNPLRFWQTVSALLLAALIAVLVLR